jgi:hypothetical protein
VNSTQATRVPRVAQAIAGAAAGRRHIVRAAIIGRQLEQITPGIVRVRIVPVWTDRDGTGRVRTWVALDDALGAVAGTREQHRAAHGLITRMHPGADWTRAHTYDARTGELTLDQSCAPAELTAEAI